MSAEIKIFGGYAFVMRAIFGFGDCSAGHPAARPVFAGDLRGVSPVGGVCRTGGERRERRPHEMTIL